MIPLDENRDLKFSDTHAYLIVEDDRARIGITQFAVDQLGDITYVELPEVGQLFEQGDTYGNLDASHGASELVIPISGRVLTVNYQVKEEPQTIHDDCYGDGWLIEVLITQPDDIAALLDGNTYRALLSDALI